jgi:PHD/YefM family antitoxin component YafN of YafNO toxin-antitoxin module
MFIKDKKMMELKPSYIEKNGKKEFVVLSIEEFQSIQEQLIDYDDLKELRKAKFEEKDVKGYSLAEVRNLLS